MGEIARSLEGAGFDTFLPQRDGLLYDETCRAMRREGFEAAEAAETLQRAIFCLDAYQLLEVCDGLACNLNGRTPDEGAVAEAALAWGAGKAVVLYRADPRSPLQGRDNPLVAGLGGFVTVPTVPEIAYAFAQLFRARRPTPPAAHPPGVRAAVEAGRRLARSLARDRGPEATLAAVRSLVRERSPGRRP